MTAKRFQPYLFLSAILIFFATVIACNSEKRKARVKRDETVSKQNAFLNLFLDSAQVTAFLDTADVSSEDSAQIQDFYSGRNYEYAWFDSIGLTEHAANFVSLYRSYRTSNDDSALINKKLDKQVDGIMLDTSYQVDNAAEKRSIELGLTRQFFLYTEKAYTAEIKPEEMDWFIPEKKIDIKNFLDSVVANNKGKIKDFEPVHPMFTPLHDYLKKYTALDKKNDWQAIPYGKKAYKEGDSAAAIGSIKTRLQVFGDLPDTDTGNVFTEATKEGIKNFQARFGLKDDGVAGKKVIDELNVPMTERVKQLVVNIERIKWIPKPTEGRYILVNIPAFKFYAYDHGKVQWSMNVVVGALGHNTVVFSDMLETIAFSPYWNVPYSIVKNEMTGKSASYFERNNMEIVGKYSDGRPQVRQKPGPKNSLGRVKFLFPNSYSIYFHDTPAKWLFSQNDRAASHGCIRLSDPPKLAAWLLDYDPKWTMDSIKKMMDLPKEKQVKLENPVPVFIGYFTAWVDSAGKLNFRDDIYGHDKKMIARLFK